jgi:hypothetical protein
MVANEALDSFIGIVNRLPLISSQSEENAARNRWEGEGGNSGELQTSAASEELAIPILVSTEQAVSWGSRLNADQHTMLVEKQQVLSRVALTERNLQRMVNLATQSQLLREAAEAFEHD